MGVRKNASFLSTTEQENFVRACVLMKADIVNPAAPAASQYSRWDQFVAIHWMIQDAIAPGAAHVNFGHGGISAGAYSFLSWHRYYLYRLEQQLQTYVPGVMIPYWDWTNPAPIMTDTFMGPNGTVNREVRSGYFARNAPGTPGNVTPAPAWWPASLTGWLLPAAFGSIFSGALRRQLGALSSLPSTNDIRESLAKSGYHDFTWAVESGTGLTSAHGMHNRMHTWLGGGTAISPGHMSAAEVSSFDPLFYLHHCNIDRLWAMWQADGHAAEYPAAGALLHHGPMDLMYPWTGGAAGYGTNVVIGSGASAIPMPDFAALGPQRNIDTLDYRAAYGYSYDTLPVIGIGLDRTGSMTGLTPDPMMTSAPDVTKWEAAKRGVSAFLQDCETVQDSGLTYVTAGVRTFRRLGAGNDFTSVLPAPGFGLVKNGGTFSRAAFDSAIASMAPLGSTPLADALLDVQNTLVEAPFAGAPADEQRYLAMLTDGLLTAGAPLSSIGDASLSRTAIFAMGFGTGADVDYPTLQSIIDKGRTLTSQQLFHGESAGTIDKFYTNALARAIGFTAVFDPVLELFAGEHTHLSFTATSADDAFLLTVQGMDFDDDNWTFHLHGPDDSLAYADGGEGHGHGGAGGHAGCHHCCRKPHVTVSRARGRLTIVLQRDNTDDACWVGEWTLMAAYKARRLDGMMMPTPGSLIFPLAAGPARGPRYSRLLTSPKERLAQRSAPHRPLHGLDTVPVSTNRSGREACDLVMNVYARSRVSVELAPRARRIEQGEELALDIVPVVSAGNVSDLRGVARLVAPSRDLAELLAGVRVGAIPKEAALTESNITKFDPALLLAKLERRQPKAFRPRDQELKVESHHGPLHLHVQDTRVPGAYHVGLYVEGLYCPEHGVTAGGGHEHSAPDGGGHTHTPPAEHAGNADPAGHAEAGAECGPDCMPQRISRLLTTMVVVQRPERQARATPASSKRKRP